MAQERQPVIDRVGGRVLSALDDRITPQLHASIAETDPSIDPVFNQPRVGQYGKIYEIPKTRTLHPSDNRTPINDTLAEAREKGWDELPQTKLIVTGEMALYGWRPRPKTTYDLMMDAITNPTRVKFERRVLRTLHGILGSFVISTHIGKEVPPEEWFQRWAEADIKDATDRTNARQYLMTAHLGLRVAVNRMVDPLTLDHPWTS